MAISSVASCSPSSRISSAASRSAWLPSDTKRENPSPAASASTPSSSARFPLWDRSPMDPRGRSFGTSSSSAAASKMPRQFGPRRATPASRARLARARSRAPPASPSSAPAVITTMARVPAAIVSCIAASSAAGGTASTASSGASGSSPSVRYARVPMTSPPRRLTRYTARRDAPRRAPRASQFPHLAGSFEAPTTATDSGSKSGVRSRRVVAALHRTVATRAVELLADQPGGQAQMLERVLRRARVTLFDRVEEPLVVAHIVRPGIRRVVVQQHPGLRDERLVGARQPRAAGQPNELLVKADVRLDHLVGDAIVSLGPRPQILQGGAQGREVRRRRGLDREPGDAGLDCLSGHVDVEAVRERHDAHERAAVQLVVHEPLLHELPDCLAYGASPGPQCPRERDLPKRLPLRDSPINDRFAQLLKDLLRRRGSVDRAESPVV